LGINPSPFTPLNECRTRARYRPLFAALATGRLYFEVAPAGNADSKIKPMHKADKQSNRCVRFIPKSYIACIHRR
jgi:hypothetical protein